MLFAGGDVDTELSGDTVNLYEDMDLIGRNRLFQPINVIGLPKIVFITISYQVISIIQSYYLNCQ
ncbi:MAG: hypothetical protein CL874_04840 [Dehalococcoidales bacterium]|nr:hypothetical protein [Dehalococcoidales bacterium]